MNHTTVAILALVVGVILGIQFSTAHHEGALK